VFSADNGGPIYNNGSAGANNYPLKGGKMNNWEGGIRVNSWISGGFLPVHMRGTKYDGLVTAWDYYATFSASPASTRRTTARPRPTCPRSTRTATIC
jgi:arylsulfatase I/J